MYIPHKWLLVYAIAVNAIAVVLTLWDKHRAKRRKGRVSESTLLWWGAVGGAPLMLLAMLLSHHKTKHAKFMVGLPLLLLMQGFVLYMTWVEIV